MKHWSESRDVLGWISERAREGHRVALATVIRVDGSAYRREGAKLAVADDGRWTGNVSGGCLELDVRETAIDVLTTGLSRIRTYHSSSDEIRAWDLGVGCDGEVEIQVELVDANVATECELLSATALPFAAVTIAAEHQPLQQRLVVTARGVHGTVGSGQLDLVIATQVQAMLADSAPPSLVAFGGLRVFVDTYQPPPHLIIASAGDDSRPLASFAHSIGMRVSVIDHRPALLDPARFPAGTALHHLTAAALAEGVRSGEHVIDPESFLVIMTHNYADDRDYLGAALATSARYIGILGPRRRTQRLLAEFGAADPGDKERIYGPVGLDLCTDGAEQVALAIVAEILAVYGRRAPRSLRDRNEPIHT